MDEDEISGRWDEIAVRQAFPTFEAEAILDIPLNPRGGADTRFWQGSDKGIYSVKSGYSLEVNIRAPPQFQSSQPNLVWWKILWRLALPPKVRIFMWRASRDLLPTAANLFSRYVPTNGICPLCKLCAATTSHCLIFCSIVKFVWKNSLFWFYLRKMQSATFLDCALIIAEKMPLEDLEKFVIMVWAVWMEYCIRSHSEVRQLGSFDVDWVFSYLNAFRKAKNVGFMLHSTEQISSDISWKAPILNQFRVDVDAGFDGDSNP